MASFESFDGVKLSYEIDGDAGGVTVLLLHGYATDSYVNWVRPGVVDRLTSSGYRTVAVDQRGHGLSDKPHDPSAYADGAMTKDARALLDHLEVSRCLLAGYSMGAMNALGLLTQGEERVAAAVLGGIGVNMLAGPQGSGSIADAMLAADKSEITNPFARSFRDFADLTRADKEALAAIQRQPRAPVDGLDRVSVPVLVLCGDNDPLAGDPHALAEKIPGARAAVVGGSHLNVVNNPEFHNQMAAFLDTHRGSS